MKKGFKVLALSMAAFGVLSMGTVALATTSAGSEAALGDKEYTVEEMLVYAIEDEYMAQAEYGAIVEKFGAEAPISNILRAEGNHINQVQWLLDQYKVTVPERNWDETVVVPESMDAAYETGIKAEEDNITMYENFLKQDLPDDVKAVFERLVAASEHHKYALESALDGNIICGTGTYGNGTGMGYGRMNGRGYGRNGNGLRNGTGAGQGAGAGYSGSCIYY